MKIMKLALLAALVPGTAFADSSDTKTEQAQVNTTGQSAQLGLTALAMTADRRADYGAPKDAGLLVTKVEEGGPAAKAGVKVGDVITKIGDTDLKTSGDLVKATKDQKDNEAKISIVRDHHEMNVQAKLDEGFQKKMNPGYEQPKGT